MRGSKRSTWVGAVRVALGAHQSLDHRWPAQRHMPHHRPHHRWPAQRRGPEMDGIWRIEEPRHRWHMKQYGAACPLSVLARAHMCHLRMTDSDLMRLGLRCRCQPRMTDSDLTSNPTELTMPRTPMTSSPAGSGAFAAHAVLVLMASFETEHRCHHNRLCDRNGPWTPSCLQTARAPQSN